MRHFSMMCAALTLGGVALIALASGCGRPAEKPVTPGPGPEDKKNVAPAGAKKAIAAGDAVIKGKVVYDGDPPEPKVLPQIVDPKNKPNCHAKDAKENVEQTWMVGKDKGVANVVIFLKPPADGYFDPPDSAKKRDDEVVLKQPHCAFIPHVLALNTYYFDGKGLKETGQKLKVWNNADFLHNTKISGDPLKGNVSDETLKPDKAAYPKLKPEAKPIAVSCSVHAWMSAKIWNFDHPYAVVTGEDGTFEIKNVPVDTEISVVGWHESPEFFYGGSTGTKMTLKKGETKDLETLKIKAP